MKIIKYTLVTLGILALVLSIINSVYENSIMSNKWTFAMGGFLLWLAFDKKLQKKFEKF